MNSNKIAKIYVTKISCKTKAKIKKAKEVLTDLVPIVHFQYRKKYNFR